MLDGSGEQEARRYRVTWVDVYSSGASARSEFYPFGAYLWLETRGRSARNYASTTRFDVQPTAKPKAMWPMMLMARKAQSSWMRKRVG